MRTHHHGDRAQEGRDRKEQGEREMVVGQPARKHESRDDADESATDAHQSALEGGRAGRKHRQ